MSSAYYALLGQFLPLALLLAAGLTAGRWPARGLAACQALGTGRWAPWIAGALTTLALGLVWGSLSPVATIHDEAAYLLQAQLLASGRLAGPGRPLPEFFEQFQVFVTPLLTGKYPLGFGLALVPGIWLGAPALMPLLLNGVAGGLLFALARRLTTPGVAALAWLVWLLAPATIDYHAAYLSETLSGPLWLAGWWALLEWRERGQRRWLVLLALATAACAITRPLTAVGFALPCGLVVLVLTARRGSWADLVVAAGAGTAIVSLLLYQDVRVTGSWRETPWERYAEVYAPVDRPGFTMDTLPPERELPPDMQAYIAYFREAHVGFRPGRLPAIFAARVLQVLKDAWGDWLPALLPCAAIGLLVASPEVLFGLGCLLSLLLVHLIFAHPVNWSIYYQEGQPALAVVTALGMARALGGLLRRGIATGQAGERSALAVWLAVACAAGLALPIVADARHKRSLTSAYHSNFRQRLEELPDHSILFVRYEPTHRFYYSLITNPPDLDRARTWIVHDLGPENQRLIALAPDRVPYLYIEQKKLMVPLAPDGTVAGAPPTTSADEHR
ncbi:MAG: hypothetical protein ACHQ2E_05670 [Gemmatimonadales bacterium]